MATVIISWCNSMKLFKAKRGVISARLPKLESQLYEQLGKWRKGNGIHLDLPPFHIKSSQADLSGIKIINSYPVGPSTVYITENYEYLVSDPPITAEDQRKLEEIVYKLLFLVPGSTLRDEQKFNDYISDCGLSEDRYNYFLCREIFGYGQLEPVVMDPLIEDVVVASSGRPVACNHSSYGKMPTNLFFSAEEMGRYIERHLLLLTRTSPPSRPRISVRLPQGKLLSASNGEVVSPEGPNFIIRKLPENPWSITSLLLRKSISPEMAAWLMLLQEHKKSFLVAGAMGAGKTSLINALCNFIPERSMIVTVEETPELKMAHTTHLSMIARREQALNVDCDFKMSDLLEEAVHMPADYIIVGDVMGEEGRTWARALRSGYAGIASLTSEDPLAAIEVFCSPPISAEKSSLRFLTGVVSVKKSVQQIRGRPMIRRRVLNFYDLGPGLELTPLFDYDGASDSFSLRTDSILESNSAKAMMHSSGLSESALLDRYLKRVDFLQKLSNVSKYKPILMDYLAATKAAWSFQSSPDNFNAEEFAFVHDEAHQGETHGARKELPEYTASTAPAPMIQDVIPGWMRKGAGGRESS